MRGLANREVWFSGLLRFAGGGANRVVIEDMNRGHDTAAELSRELHGMEIEVELIKPTTSKLARMSP